MPTALVPGEIQDLQLLPQQTGYYLGAVAPTTLLLSSVRQQQLGSAYRQQYFAVWDQAAGAPSAAEAFWALPHYGSRQVYGENLLPLPQSWLAELADACDQQCYPRLHKPAITVLTAALRLLPRHRPVFADPAMPGNGFPFDLLQNSLVAAGTPILVVHATTDCSWFLVKTAHNICGWLRPWEFAWVDADFIAAYQSAPLLAVVADDVSVSTGAGDFVFASRIGMLLPQAVALSAAALPSGMQQHTAVLVAQRAADGSAVISTAMIAAAAIMPWPMPATVANFSAVLDALLGQCYGWGGLYENRDCSALMQDVFALLAITLPRNSSEQAQAGVQQISLDNLDRAVKQQMILEHGIALLTLINLPGHVMLYLGRDPQSAQPVVLHSIWGLRCQPLPAAATPPVLTGRWILGRAVITSLTPGAELAPLIDPQQLLCERVNSMTLLR